MSYVISGSLVVFVLIMVAAIMYVTFIALLTNVLIRKGIYKNKKKVYITLVLSGIIILFTAVALIKLGFPIPVEAAPERPAVIIDKNGKLVGLYNEPLLTNHQRYAQFFSGLQQVEYWVKLPAPYAEKLGAGLALVKVIWQVDSSRNYYLFQKKVAALVKNNTSQSIDLDQWINKNLQNSPWQGQNLLCGVEVEYKNYLQNYIFYTYGVNIWGVNVIMLSPPTPRGPHAN